MVLSDLLLMSKLTAPSRRDPVGKGASFPKEFLWNEIEFVPTVTEDFYEGSL